MIGQKEINRNKKLGSAYESHGIIKKRLEKDSYIVNKIDTNNSIKLLHKFSAKIYPTNVSMNENLQNRDVGLEI